MVRKVIQRFSSFAERDEANRRYYASLTPQERLDILLELVFGHAGEAKDGHATEGFQRVYRVIKLGER